MDSDASAAVPRRSSGRVRTRPNAHSVEPSSGGKRKRNDDGGREMSEGLSDADEPSDEGEPDPEEIRDRSRKAQKAKSSAPRKRAPKQAKMQGTLPIRNGRVAGAARKKASKQANKLAAPVAEDADSIYAKVFGSEHTLQSVVADWLEKFDTHESGALSDVVNFVLRCAGCTVQTTDHDMEDPDGATNRLTDIQEEYQASSPTDYPLITKGKAGAAFKQTLSDFLGLLIRSSAAKGKLFGESALVENVEVWLSTMSSAGNRAFRHTATVASLAVVTALCEVAAEGAQEAAAAQRQAEVESKKPKANKARVKQLGEKVRLATASQEYLEAQLKDWFDTVFIHRYRDVDAGIRRDCVAALGDWISIFPDIFFDGKHLRYLGWVLSDTAAPTRGEVVRQLHRLYRAPDKIAGLKTFTERFRVRMVEMATEDAEMHVRAAAIELLECIREHGLLEPDDIDKVGGLIYDSDVRIRKAVARFFTANVTDLCSAKVDQLGDSESLEDALPEVGDDEFESPRVEWLKLKSLAETMVASDQSDDLPPQVERNRSDGSLLLRAGATDSRASLAAHVLFDTIPEVQDWQTLAGYLLFDHSARRPHGASNTVLSQLKHECVLAEPEDAVLLEVLHASVKRTIAKLADPRATSKSKPSQKHQAAVSDAQESAARHLAHLLPRLLNKFGDAPASAAAVLRIGAALHQPALQHLRPDPATHARLLADIQKQFLAHATDDVLRPATEALLHAHASALDLAPADADAPDRLPALWDDVLAHLAARLDPPALPPRGSLAPDALAALSNALLRITRLSQVSNPTSPLEAATAAGGTPAIDSLLTLIARAHAPSPPAALEDEVAARATAAALRYLQWKFAGIIRCVSSGAPPLSYPALEALATRRDAFVAHVAAALRARRPRAPLARALAPALLDLHSSAAVLRGLRARTGAAGAAGRHGDVDADADAVDDDDWDVLVLPLQDAHLRAVWRVFAAAESACAAARGAHRKFVVAHASDDDGDGGSGSEGSDAESDDSDDPDVTGAATATKATAALVAEQTLCELARALVYAVHARVVDAERTRARLMRNCGALGANYREVVAYLEVGGQMARGQRKKKAVGKGGKRERVVEEEVEEGEEEGGEDGIEDGGEAGPPF